MEPKSFQIATIRAALDALNTGNRRFLLADEVGLGKTVVAREVIRELSSGKRDRPFRVFYVSSNQSLSAQNAPRLICDDIADQYELVDASRPSLLPNGEFRGSSNARVQIFRFSPETSLPILKRRARDGVVAERALAFVLRSRVLKWRLPRGYDLKRQFKGRASDQSFLRAVRAANDRYRRHVLMPGFGYSAAFRRAAQTAFQQFEGNNLQEKLDKVAKSDAKSLIGYLRLALTLASLDCAQPDLIIFDEFHRYQDRAFRLALEQAAASTPQSHGNRYSNFLALLPAEHPPRLLLLSATPFKFTSGGTGSGASDADLFYQLVGFLHGDGDHAVSVYKNCRAAFRVYETELAAGRFTSDALRKAKRTLESVLLRPRMSRMERSAFHRTADPESRHLAQFPTPSDIDLLVRFARGLRPDDQRSAVNYWRSVPLPHQTLGPNYKVWDRASHPQRWHQLPGVREKERNTMRLRQQAYHPKLRALLECFPPETLAIPWLRPSRPWWPLEGPWAADNPNIQKGLLFSRYKAVPTAVAGLLSLAVEEWSARRFGWTSSAKLSKRSFLTPKTVSNVFLFHPSTWLASKVDPLAHISSDRRRIIASVARSLEAALPPTVRLDPKSKSSRPPWQVLAMIEVEAKAVPLAQVWNQVTTIRQRSQLQRSLDRIAAAAAKVERIVSRRELNALAWFALTSPGVVLLRSLHRHNSEIYQTGIQDVAKLAWNGLRSYLDQPWFVARLSGTRKTSYTTALQGAVYQGNLEACLDEHFWLPDPDNPKWLSEKRRPGRLESLRRSLSIRSAPIVFQLPGSLSKKHVRLAAHTALPLTDSATQIATEAGVEELRADDLRRAFNSPFWPHLLCTTSVGQEGLDFHQWCQTVIHWDLPAGPIELEQREGRVDRFKGLAVRRAISMSPSSNGSALRWSDFGNTAEGLTDASGLRPWWVADDAKMTKLYLDAPASDERLRRNELSRLRELYRLVLGTPNQWDLLARLAASDIDIEVARKACLDLAAWRERSG